MLWLFLFMSTACSGLNVRFEDAQGRPIQPIYREEYIYKNINGRMEQFAVQPGADTPDWGKPGHGREVFIHYIPNPPDYRQRDNNDNIDNSNGHRRQESDEKPSAADTVYSQSKEFIIDSDKTNDAYTDRKDIAGEQELAMDRLQNDQPIQSYTPQPLIKTSVPSYINSTQRVKSSTDRYDTRSRSSTNSTVRSSNEPRTSESTTKRVTTRSDTRNIEYSKSTRDNEVTVKPTDDKKGSKDEGDRWVWINGEKVTSPPTTNVTFEDRASFTGDNCPTGKIRFNGVCVKADKSD